MVAAVTGAAGHVGANLVRELLKQGRKVRVLVRGDTRGIDGLDVEIVRGDVLDRKSLKELFTGAGTVFHLAALISIMGSEGGRVEKINVQGPDNVASVCRKCGVKRLIHCSSIHAFTSLPGDQVVSEETPLALEKHHFAYDRSKAMGQTRILEHVKGGLDAVIVNPGAVVGPHDYKGSRMGEVLLDIYHGRFPMLVDGGYDWVDVRDVVAGILAAETKGRTGEAYLLTGHWVHVRDIACMIEEITGRKTVKKCSPIWLAKLFSYPALWWAKLRKKAAKFTPQAMDSLTFHRYISHEKAVRELGYSARPFKETVRDTLEWFRGEGQLEAGGKR